MGAATLSIGLAAGAAAALPESLLDFDIPAQPLEDALLRYGEATRRPALYPSDQMSGLRSAPLHGRYTPDQALRRLLAGTGLVPEKVTRAHGEVIRLRRFAAPSPVPGDEIDVARAGADLNGFQADLQAAVLSALCADARTTPGRYGAMFDVAVDAAGTVIRTSLIASTGDARRDALLLAAVRDLRIGQPPAQSVLVPYLITLAPTPAQTPPACRAAAGDGR